MPSCLGEMAPRAFAFGERPSGYNVPTLPLLTGEDAWGSLSGHGQDSAQRAMSGSAPYKQYPGAHGLHKRAYAVKIAAYTDDPARLLREHPAVAGFLRRCGELHLSEDQIAAGLCKAAEVDAEFSKFAAQPSLMSDMGSNAARTTKGIAYMLGGGLGTVGSGLGWLGMKGYDLAADASAGTGNWIAGYDKYRPIHIPEHVTKGTADVFGHMTDAVNAGASDVYTSLGGQGLQATASKVHPNGMVVTPTMASKAPALRDRLAREGGITGTWQDNLSKRLEQTGTAALAAAPSFLTGGATSLPGIVGNAARTSELVNLGGSLASGKPLPFSPGGVATVSATSGKEDEGHHLRNLRIAQGLPPSPTAMAKAPPSGGTTPPKPPVTPQDEQGADTRSHFQKYMPHYIGGALGAGALYALYQAMRRRDDEDEEKTAGAPGQMTPASQAPGAASSAAGGLGLNMNSGGTPQQAPTAAKPMAPTATPQAAPPTAAAQATPQSPPTAPPVSYADTPTHGHTVGGLFVKRDNPLPARSPMPNDFLPPDRQDPVAPPEVANATGTLREQQEAAGVPGKGLSALMSNIELPKLPGAGELLEKAKSTVSAMKPPAPAAPAAQTAIQKTQTTTGPTPQSGPTGQTGQPVQPAAEVLKAQQDEMFKSPDLLKDPAKAKEQLGAHVQQQLMDKKVDPSTAEGRKVVTNLASGKLTPQQKQEGLDKYVQSHGDKAKEPGMLDQLVQQYQGMSGVQQGMLWLGLGAGALGLLSTLFGEGGMGMGLLSLLGLGLGAGAMASGGMFGQGAQQGINGLMQKITGGAPSPAGAKPPAVAPAGADIAKAYAGEIASGRKQYADWQKEHWLQNMVAPQSMREQRIGEEIDRSIGARPGLTLDPKVRQQLIQAILGQGQKPAGAI